MLLIQLDAKQTKLAFVFPNVGSPFTNRMLVTYWVISAKHFKCHSSVWLGAAIYQSVQLPNVENNSLVSDEWQTINGQNSISFKIGSLVCLDWFEWIETVYWGKILQLSVVTKQDARVLFWANQCCAHKEFFLATLFASLRQQEGERERERGGELHYLYASSYLLRIQSECKKPNCCPQ